VLSENGGAFFAPRMFSLGVATWRAFEVLVEAWRRGLVQDIVEELRRYEQEALHLEERLGIHMESGWEEVEARELRRRYADWDFIQRLPPRLRAALIYYIETGDLRRAQWISGLDLDHFRDLMRRASIPVVN